jgi:hypothetical protein
MGLDPNQDSAKPGSGSTTMAFGEKIDLYKKSKNLPQKQFSRHSLVRRPYWQKIFKTLLS